MKTRNILFLLTVLLCASNYASGQRFDTLLNKLDTEFPQEKLYLHFDKAIYNPGETIWFKAYIFSGTFPSMLSNTLYSELLDEQGKVLQRKISPTLLASASAAFDLPPDLTSNVLYVRAYTRWMLNFDSSFLYTKAIPIVNAGARSNSAVTAKPSATSLQFFPEGGDLVSGLQSRVAFKAVDSRGMPVPVSGELQNMKGEKIGDFKSQHDGMGLFVLQPEPGAQYKAVWKDASGQTKQTNLPAVKKDGIVLETRDVNKGIQFIVRRTDGPLAPRSVVIVAQMQQQLLYRAKANMVEGSVISGFIPAPDIPTGIVQVTVFNEEDVPMAERIVFANRQNYEFITDLNAALKNVTKRGRNVIQIDVPDTIGCNLSVSVTDADVNPSATTNNDIFSHLLLASDIKGYVHNPQYYFSSTADSVSAHLDLVMMTNGWRRFKWEDVLAGKFPKIKHEPADELAVAGTVAGLNRNQMSKREISGILELKNGTQQYLSIPVAPDGSFYVPGFFFYDTAKVYYQFSNDKNKVLTSSASFKFTNGLLSEAVKIKPDTLVSRHLRLPDSVVITKNIQVGRKTLARMDEQQKVQTLATVEVTASTKSKKQKMDEEYTSGFFRGGDDYTFITEDDPFARSAQTVFQYLQGKVPGLQISMAGGQTSLTWRGGAPLLFMNEMRGDASMLESTPMSDVALVKVFRPPFLGGFGGSSGAIAVYTKKGSAAQTENIKGLDFTSIPGYHTPKEFYSPDYSRPDERHQLEDIRTTLYWNPFVITNKDNRRIILNFYNNDITKRYRVVVEGVDAEGKLTRIEKTFE